MEYMFKVTRKTAHGCEIVYATQSADSIEQAKDAVRDLRGPSVEIEFYKALAEQPLPSGENRKPFPIPIYADPSRSH